MNTLCSARGLFAAGLAGLLAACGGGSGGGDPAAAPRLEGTPSAKLAQHEATSCEAVKSYVVDSIADLLLGEGIYPCPECRLTMAGFEPLAEDATEADGFTGTNNQEAGVDELDRIEVDQAGHFYVLDGRYLVVALGNPATELRELAHLELTGDGYPTGLVLDEANARLVIGLSGRSPASALAIVAPDYYYEPVVELLFVDVADPSRPVLDGRLGIEGTALALRRIGGRTHLVSHFTPGMPAVVLEDGELRELQTRYFKAEGDSPAAAAIADMLRARVADLLADTAATDFLPRRWHASGDGPYVPLVDDSCAGVAVPDVSMRFALTSITSVGTDGGDAATLSLTNSAWQVYASADNVYLMQTSGGWWWRERQQQQTAIYRVAVGDGEPSYGGLGVVDGWVDSSFQLSEHGGFLRVATSRDEFDPATGERRQDNHLFVLQDDGAGALATVGAVRGYAPGERIFSARFLGPRAYVVTFRQVDPLFAFDLTDPRDPRLLGELEIPGVSTYLHPLDDTHLLTIGLNGDASGLDWKVRLQIFDVQDLARPRLLHALVPDFGPAGQAWSPATYDHLAFNYFPAAGLLTIPVQYWAGPPAENFSGFVSFSVSVQEGLAEVGRMDHGDLARAAYCGVASGGAAAVACRDGDYLEAATPSRAVGGVIDGERYVFTVSDVGIKVAAADDVATAVAVLPLEYPNQYWWWY